MSIPDPVQPSSPLPDELEYRLSKWAELTQYGSETLVPASRIRDLGLYAGQRGIYTDRERTRHVGGGSSIALSVMHTGTSYPDDLTDTGVVYHYPTTKTPGRDLAEVNAAKEASTLNLPIFVITYTSTDLRRVHLGWIVDWDDVMKTFLIRFANQPPSQAKLPELQVEEIEEVFRMTVAPSEYRLRKTRKGQAEFQFRVFKRYGPACATCDLAIPQLLDAAHLAPYRYGGPDIASNGLVLCPTHHRALDCGFILIDPDSLLLSSSPSGPALAILGVTRPNLDHLQKPPNRGALLWRREHLFN